MKKEEALEKYPNLEGMSVLDLAMMRKESITTKDYDFVRAIDAITNNLTPNKE